MARFTFCGSNRIQKWASNWLHYWWRIKNTKSEVCCVTAILVRIRVIPLRKKHESDYYWAICVCQKMSSYHLTKFILEESKQQIVKNQLTVPAFKRRHSSTKLIWAQGSKKGAIGKQFMCSARRNSESASKWPLCTPKGHKLDHFEASRARLVTVD